MYVLIILILKKATLNELTRIVCSHLFAIFKEKILTNLFYVELGVCTGCCQKLHCINNCLALCLLTYFILKSTKNWQTIQAINVIVCK